MPLWIKLETKSPIMSPRLDLDQAREGSRCHDGLSVPMYGNMFLSLVPVTVTR